jgi:dCTP diphosphatase
MNDDLHALTTRLRAFAKARDWEQFHSPKNLATALSVEAAELLEHFQWLSDDASRKLDTKTMDAVTLEAADVLLYLLMFADKTGIDLVAAADRKMRLNEQRYPADKARGITTAH